MALSPETLETIRAKTVLSDLIGKSLELSKVADGWKATCPFHSDQSISLLVNDKKGFYHCFGCGAHGDAIQWLTDHDHMKFLDAVTTLAQSTGTELVSVEQSSAPRPVQTTRPRGGGKLSRSETVTIRLDPKLNYLCDLAARAQRRTKSSFIEWAISASLSQVGIEDANGNAWGAADEQSSLQDYANQLWHVDEPDRLVALALLAPSLMNHEEQMIWRFVRENGFLWRGSYNNVGEWAWPLRIENLIIERLRTHWSDFKNVALEGHPENLLPKWQKRKNPSDELDDDIPF